MSTTKHDILRQLQRDILSLQGFRPPSGEARIDMGLGPIISTFPNAVFPTGAIHEFISSGSETAAASAGFISGLTAALMRTGGACLWISTSRLIYPPALKQLGIEPDRVIFIDLKREKEIFWAMEEALACEGLAAVVGEVRELDFTTSRRLQLAVEKSRSTGFILRDRPRNLNPNATVARWKIQSIASETPVRGMPGVGFPRWSVELLRVKNGHPGKWQLEWAAGQFQFIYPYNLQLQPEGRRKAG